MVVVYGNFIFTTWVKANRWSIFKFLRRVPVPQNPHHDPQSSKCLWLTSSMKETKLSTADHHLLRVLKITSEQRQRKGEMNEQRKKAKWWCWRSHRADICGSKSSNPLHSNQTKCFFLSAGLWRLIWCFHQNSVFFHSLMLLGELGILPSPLICFTGSDIVQRLPKHPIHFWQIQ